MELTNVSTPGRLKKKPRGHAVGGLETHTIDGDFHLPGDRTQRWLHLARVDDDLGMERTRGMTCH